MILTCPNCGQAAQLSAEPACPSCSWSPLRSDGVIILLDQADRSGPTFPSYLENYDRIADDDLSSPILDLEYVRRQASNLANAAGNVAGLEVLDLGCGQGFLTRALIAAGARSVTAVDISMAYLRRLVGLTGITPVQENAERLLFKDSFDLLVCTDVMEHVLNIGSFLISMNQALRTDGVAILRVPYREDLTAYAAQRGAKYEFVHLRSFNRQLLHDTLGSAGFAVEATWLDGFSLYSPQPFWIAGARRKALYLKFQKSVISKVSHPAVVTNWPWRVARLFMRPAEIVVRARKIRSVLP